jgi:hypothetical protein
MDFVRLVLMLGVRTMCDKDNQWVYDEEKVETKKVDQVVVELEDEEKDKKKKKKEDSFTHGLLV